jgi:hypothetical protein
MTSVRAGVRKFFSIDIHPKRLYSPENLGSEALSQFNHQQFPALL